jgi:gluconolactonase
LGIEVLSDRLSELIDPAAEVDRVGTGFVFTEGPIWNKAAGCLLFSDMPGDVRRRWSPERGVEEVMRPSFKTNGMVYDAGGNLLVCEHATSSVVRIREDGTRELVAYHHRGKYLNSPNDIVTRGADGSVYFSDPSYGRMPGVGIERAADLDYRGAYRVRPGSGEAELVAPEDEFDQPNGLCFSPDESLLYINDSTRAHIKVWNVENDGTLTGGRVFCEGIGTGKLAEGIPDGMKCDERGNIWVTGPGGIWVIGSDGVHLGTVRLPENAANLTWGGADWHTLFVTANTSLYAVTTKTGPAPLPYH